jgi:hypothetical protein
MPNREFHDITLQATSRREFSSTSAEILRGRGIMTLQVRAWLPGLGEVDLIASPPLAEPKRGSWEIGGPFQITSRTFSAGPC